MKTEKEMIYDLYEYYNHKFGEELNSYVRICQNDTDLHDIIDDMIGWDDRYPPRERMRALECLEEAQQILVIDLDITNQEKLMKTVEYANSRIPSYNLTYDIVIKLLKSINQDKIDYFYEDDDCFEHNPIYINDTKNGITTLYFVSSLDYTSKNKFTNSMGYDTWIEAYDMEQDIIDGKNKINEYIITYEAEQLRKDFPTPLTDSQLDLLQTLERKPGRNSKFKL